MSLNPLYLLPLLSAKLVDLPNRDTHVHACGCHVQHDSCTAWYHTYGGNPFECLADSKGAKFEGQKWPFLSSHVPCALWVPACCLLPVCICLQFCHKLQELLHRLIGPSQFDVLLLAYGALSIIYTSVMLVQP